jgi:hypothetical protein
MLVVRVKEGKREEPGEATITTKGQIPVKTEKGPDVNQQALYLIVSLLDLECSRGFRHAEMVKRKGGDLILTDKADAISDDPARIPGFVWDMGAIKEKSEQSKGIGNLWKALSAGKHTIISFKSEEDADKAYAILRAAGFEEDMLKRSSKHSIKIVEVPEKLNIEGLTARLAKNLERVKNATNAKEEAIAVAAQQVRNENADRWVKSMENPSEEQLMKLDPKSAAWFIRIVHDTASPSRGLLESMRFLLNERPDVVQIVNELRTMQPYDRMLRPFSALSKEEYVSLIQSMRDETPLGKATLKPTGNELADLRAYEAQRRGGAPSEIQKAAATPWKIPKDFMQQLDRSETTLFYTFPSAARYAEARASVEALYPGRAVSVEHTPEIEGGRDVGEWVMTVHPPGEASPDAIEVSGTIRSFVGPSADSRISWTHGGKRESLSFSSVASDAVSNYSTYTTEVMVNPGKQSEIPAWFMSFVMGKKADKLDAKPGVKRALLEKGVELKVEVARTIENDDDTKSYVYRITVSGENVRKPLEIARNEARSKPKATLPEPQLKRIAAFEGPSEEITYADRVAALKDKLKKTKPES